MQATDQAFFDAYKRLDRLCSDAFSCRNGVSAYIDEMNRCSPRGRRLVPGWEQDFSTLRSLRHLRNRMAHELNTDGLCTEADVAEAEELHARILSGDDPLARLNRVDAPVKKLTAARVPEIISYDPTVWKKKERKIWISITIVAAVICLLALIPVFFL